MQELITIGKIVNTHGVRGEVRVLPLTDFPDRFLAVPFTVWLPTGRQLTIVQARPYKQFMLVTFDRINSLNDAGPLKGAELQVRRQDLVALPPGHYYIFEIIGLSVYDTDGALLGTVSDILQTGSNDVYVVDQPDRKQPLLIPALKQVVQQIDVEHGRIVVQLPEEDQSPDEHGLDGE